MVFAVEVWTGHDQRTRRERTSTCPGNDATPSGRGASSGRLGSHEPARLERSLVVADILAITAAADSHWQALGPVQVRHWWLRLERAIGVVAATGDSVCNSSELVCLFQESLQVI